MLARTIVTCLFLAVAAQAQQEQWLQYRTVHPSQRRLGSCAGPTPRLIARKPAGLALPDCPTDRLRFTKWKTAMDQSGSRWIALLCPDQTGGKYQLYIDSDGDGRLDDETPSKASFTGGWPGRWFGPVKVLFPGEDGPVAYHLAIYDRTGPELRTTREHMWITPGGR